jgi:exosortase
VVVLAVTLQVLSLWWDVHFLSGWSLLLLVGGWVVLTQGWERLRVCLFPYFFLFLAVPIPIVPLEVFSLPLQIISAKLAATLGNLLLGLGIQRDGVTLSIGQQVTFTVAAACSGLKNIVAMFTLTILIAGLWTEQPLWKRLFLVACAPLVAIIANGVRILVILCIGVAFGQEAAEGFFHETSGLVVFVVALVGVFVFMEGLRRMDTLWHALMPSREEPSPTSAEETEEQGETHG